MVFYLFIELNSNLNKSKLSSDYSNVNLSLHFFLICPFNYFISNARTGSMPQQDLDISLDWVLISRLHDKCT